MDLIFVTPATFVIQFVILLLIIWVLNKFVFKPYLAYLDEWDLKQKKLEEDYKNIDKLVKESEEKRDEIMKEARSKSDLLILDAESIAKKKKEEIIIKAENEAKDVLSSARTEIEKERLSMLNSIKSKVTDLVLQLNSKLFKHEKVARDFVEKELDSIKI